ncbi:hypothetical protein RND81_11G182000 [Saponaria officinalis]|uniref:RRM domain-containing protein n=1 Tax=Saponaria officinalis TaxID=3572 RepID=A0AAW1HNL1_SAPOF
MAAIELDLPQEQTTVEPKPDDNGEPLTTASTATTSAKSSSDSDSDSDSDTEAEQSSQLQTLESELSRNPANYDAHVQYIQLLRKMGEIEKLRQAREAMSQIFPLTPQMWQEWAKDELTMSTGSEAVPKIEKLYERGVSDYLSVLLWCDYLEFVQEHVPSIRECSAAGVSKARHLFERALTASGLHFSDGSKIWEAYKDFEQAICLTIDESDVEGKEKQIQRVRNLYQRQLSVPLADMKSNLLAYKMWEVEQGNDLDVNSDDLNGISPHVASAYKKAMELYTARIDLEEQILKPDVPDSERLPLFKRYLKFEESAGDPARVQILYERAIAEFPIASDLWLDYTRYMDKTLKVGDVIKNVISRATRNCPWVGELWVRYLLCLERARAPEEDVSLVFEKALQCTFLSYEEYLDLFLTRIDGLRRRISAADQMQVLDYAVIRDTFQRASDYLSPQIKGTEALLRLHAYWARLELILAKDIIAARGVWESLLKISATMLEAWQGYINMEIEKGNLNEARSIYRRCYGKRFPGSGSEDICQSWLRFEREFGTLEDYDTATMKVSARLEELLLFRLKQESKTVATSSEVKEHPSKTGAREKRKLAPNTYEDQTPSKRQKDNNDSATKVVKKNKGKEQNVDEREVEETGKKLDKDQNTNASGKQPMSAKPRYTDQCTAFVSNLSLDATYEQLHKFFSDVGGVQSIRLLKNKFTGKSRGLAYVDFSDDEHLNAALQKNKRMFMKSRISIARSDPAKSKKHSGGHQNSDKEGSRILSGEQARSKTEGSSQSSKPSMDQSSSGKESGEDAVQLKGKVTFAVPRNVQTAKKQKAGGVEDETPKSNAEFRDIFIKK